MAKPARGEVLLPSPFVRFAPDYLARVERLVARVASARERREGPGRATLAGAGLEFHGYRPYRPGENLRALDWALFARLDRPFVRLARQEAAERWAILIDASASMGVGRPGKLQAAAELAGALAGLGLKAGATVQLFASRPAGEPRALLARRKTDLFRVRAFLEDLVAEGEAGLGALAAEPGRFRDAGRVFAIGDCLDLPPERLLALARRGRELACAQILAPEELVPSLAGAVEWVDAERGARRAIALDRATLAAYDAELKRRLEAWRHAAARHRATFGTWSSATPFEDLAVRLCGG